MTTRSHRTLVVIPAFNEQESVAYVVSEVVEEGYSVAVVDDGSSDATARVALEAGAVVLRLATNLGVGAALRCGFRYAVAQGFDEVIQCDGDGQHDPAFIDRLQRVADERSADLVIGSRFSGEGGFEATRTRRFAIGLLSRVATRAAGSPITDASSGFRLVREPLLSEFARLFPSHYLGDTFEVLVASGRAGYRVAEVPVVMRDRMGGQPSAGSVASLRFLARVLLVLVLQTTQRFRPRP